MDSVYYIDLDPRPRTYPCWHCARDKESSAQCICVPSRPRNFKIGPTVESDRLIEE